MENPVFVVGSPRSGTTLLGDVLDLHDQLALWYEPYFVFDRYFQQAPNDQRTVSDVSPPVRDHILRELNRFSRRHPGCLIIDKSPRNSLKLPFLRELFPGAKFIHIVRDGRDTTLSIRTEWQKRRAIINQNKNLFRAFVTLKRHVDRQPLLRHKLQVLNFEFGQPFRALKGRPQVVHTTRRWHGRIGWGPQFEGWQDVIDQVPLLHFNALQWKNCVEAILAEKPNFSPASFLEIRYESFIQRPLETLEQIFSFLGVAMPDEFVTRMPSIMASNFDKWKSAFAPDEKRLIGPLINPLLVQLGYAEDDHWYA